MKINSLTKPIQFLIKCVEGSIDTINLYKNKSIKVHTGELYMQFIDHFGFTTNVSKIDFSRQLNKFGLKSKQIRISGDKLRGYELIYNEIVTKLKELKIEIQVEVNIQENDEQENNVQENNMNKFRINDLDF